MNPGDPRVLRVYHSGRDRAHRERERRLAALGVDVTLVVPAAWPEGEKTLSSEDFRMIELPVSRSGDVNRHHYAAKPELERVIREVAPDVLDIHEEPFSVAARRLAGSRAA